MVSHAASLAAETTDSVRAGVAELGKRWNGEINAATTALYTQLHRAQNRPEIRIVEDVAYGNHPLQTFDLALPAAGAEAPSPIVVYFHGGGFVRGDKRSADSDDLIYANVARFFARQGFIGLNANYRLAPEASWPAGPEDLRAIVAWLGEHAAGYGGDAGQIFVMGNSAGAAHVAAYLWHTDLHFDDGPRVAGALLSSGAFASGDGDGDVAYYGSDAEARRARSPLGLLASYAGPSVPTFLWSAQYDPGFIEQAVAELYGRLCAKFDDCPRFAQFQGHNHVSHVMSLDSADGEVGAAVLDFITSVTQSASSNP